MAEPRKPDEALQEAVKRLNVAIASAVEQRGARTPAGLLRAVKSALRGGTERTRQAGRAYLLGLGGRKSAEARGIARDTYIEFAQKMKFAEDDLMDRLRKIIDAKSTEPAHLNTIRNTIRREFAREGITRVTYANGVKVSLGAYSEMCARTARIETANVDAIAEAKRLDTDYVYLPKAPTSCKICAQRSGRVYCISGRDPRYPKVYGSLFTGQYNTIHPNCRCRIVPYFPEQDSREEREKLEKYSARPFTDDRSEAARRAYAEGQAYNRRRWAEAREYDTMARRLGDAMPYNSLRTYRQARTMWVKNHGDTRGFWADKMGLTNPQSRVKISLQFFAYKNLATMSDNQIRKSIVSHNARMEEHLYKLNHPSEFYKGWDGLSDKEKTGRLQHWAHEIKVLREQVADEEAELKERSNK